MTFEKNLTYQLRFQHIPIPLIHTPWGTSDVTFSENIHPVKLKTRWRTVVQNMFAAFFGTVDM